MKPDARIFVAGHRGLVGSAIVRRLESAGFTNLLLRTRAELDLTDQAATYAFFDRERPTHVFMAAAKVGGILANDSYPADFLHQNLVLEANVFEGARRAGVEKFLFLGSSCIYPKHAPQPMKEDALLSGPLEPTNQWYAIAKIAGIKLAEAYRKQHGMHCISAMPTNLYGPGDNFDLRSSHVLPALLRKFHEAKTSSAPSVTVWGSGTPRREFLHVDDLADACVFLMERYDDAGFVNVGVGKDLTIAELAALVADVVGYQGDIVYDRSKPDGTPQKLLDVSRLTALGWTAKTSLRDGIQSTYAWFLANGDVAASV
ncbi:MAG: GDP-L-fucose synthase [Polyangiales bacterium]